jgi:hypothetical protein
VAINGGAETSDGPSSALALPAAWNAQVLSHGATGSLALDGGLARQKGGPLTFGGQTIDSIAKARAA